jgi:hypothetical protein
VHCTHAVRSPATPLKRRGAPRLASECVTRTVRRRGRGDRDARHASHGAPSPQLHGYRLVASMPWYEFRGVGDPGPRSVRRHYCPERGSRRHRGPRASSSQMPQRCSQHTVLLSWVGERLSHLAGAELMFVPHFKFIRRDALGMGGAELQRFLGFEGGHLATALHPQGRPAALSTPWCRRPACGRRFPDRGREQ